MDRRSFAMFCSSLLGLLAGLSEGQTPSCGSTADIIFSIDSSGSVGSANFKKTIAFVKTIIDGLNIGPNQVRVGVETFSSTVHVEFTLDVHSDKTSLINAVDAITYKSGGTNTAIALSSIYNKMFTTQLGDRQGVPNIAVIITDGRSANALETAKEAQKLHALGIDTFAIGIGAGVAKNELNSIASAPNTTHAMVVDSFQDLQSIAAKLQTSICAKTPFTGKCEDSQLVTCTDSHVCVSALKDICPISCGLCAPVTTPPPTTPTPCLDATFVKCNDSHVCSDTRLRSFCPRSCGICVSQNVLPTTTRGPCEDATFIQCGDSHVCTDDGLKKYCPKTCGACSTVNPIQVIG